MAKETFYNLDVKKRKRILEVMIRIFQKKPFQNVTVKEIVDEAIARAEKGGIKKMFSILTSRRYTRDDYIALREKDFDE